MKKSYLRMICEIQAEVWMYSMRPDSHTSERFTGIPVLFGDYRVIMAGYV